MAATLGAKAARMETDNKPGGSMMGQRRELDRGTSTATLSAVVPSLTDHVFQASRHPMAVLHSDLRVQMANRAFYAALRTTASRLDGHFLDDLYRESWEAIGFRSSVTSVVGKNELNRVPATFDLPDAGAHIFLLDARRIGGDGGIAEAILIELEDVTEREGNREETASHTANLERSNSDLEQFAYVASHDLQEPLRMIGSYTQLLGDRYRGRLDEDADEFIRFAVDGVHRMQSLIDGLLAYSRLSRKAADFREIDCNAVMATVQADLEKIILESDATITSDRLPPITGDTVQIGQLFQNLISNALKFRNSGVSPRIHVSASIHNGDHIFSVQDNGIGIPEDQRGRLFQVFQRLHSRTEYPGTGIGLAQCKKIVENHGGRIWLESNPGKGTIFWFTVSVKREGEKCPSWKKS